MNRIYSRISGLLSPFVPALAAGLSLIAGLAVAVMLSYLLYRIGLPSTPFIYVSF